MDEDKKITISDDEFHFTEAEEVKSNLYNVPAEDSSGKTPVKINRRKILIAIGIIIVALSFYKLIDIFLDSSSKKPPETTTTPVPTVTATEPVIPVESQPSTTPPSDLKNQLSQMQQNDATTTQQMSAVSDQLYSINNSMTNLTNQLSDLNQQLQALASQVQSQQMTINDLKFKPKSKAMVVHKFFPPPPPRWYIQAMVPGRAWLVQANGLTTTTVSKGDRLAGYGRVTWISVVNGLVKTSTGAILRYRDL